MTAARRSPSGSRIAARGLDVVVGDQHGRGLRARRQARRVRDADRALELACPIEGRADAELHVVPGAVVAALGLRHERPAREGARDAHGHHHGLGARVREADALDRADALAQHLREPHRVLVRRGEACALGELRPDRLDDGRMGVAVDQRGVVVEQLDVAIAVDVVEVRAGAATRERRVRREPRRGARIASGHRSLRLGVQLRGPRRACGVALGDRGHQSLSWGFDVNRAAASCWAAPA